MNRLRIPATVAILVIWSAVGIHAQQQDVAWAVAQAPADSLFVAGTRDLGGLWTGLKDLTGKANQIPDIPALVAMQLPAGVDVRGAMAMVILPGTARPSVVIMSRMKPGATLAGEKLDGGAIKVTTGSGMDTYALKMDSWVAISDNLASIKAVSAAKSRVAVSAQQKTEINSRSMWAWVNTKALTAKIKASVPKDPAADKTSAQGPNPVMIADWATGLLDQIGSLTAALDVKPEATALSVGLEYVPNSQLALLAASGMPILTYKAGLPASDQVLIAGWGRVDWPKAVAPTKTMLKPLLDSIVPASNAGLRKTIDELWAIYGEWATALGSEVGFVIEPAPVGEGMYRLVETFAVNNPEAFRKLAAKAMPLSADLTKAFANLGPVPGGAPAVEVKVDHKPAAETIEGVPVDVVASKMVFKTSPEISPDEQEAAQKMMDSLYGPDGMTMRMAVVGRTAVINMGGKTAMAGAIRAAKDKAPDLSTNPKVAAALARVPKTASFAGVISLPTYAHFTFTMMQRMMAGAAAAGNKPSTPAGPAMGDLVTFSLRMQGATQYLDLNVPKSEIRGMLGIFERMMAGTDADEPGKDTPAPDANAAPRDSK